LELSLCSRSHIAKTTLPPWYVSMSIKIQKIIAKSPVSLILELDCVVGQTQNAGFKMVPPAWKLKPSVPHLPLLNLAYLTYLC
jgi:hypothetical protein